MHPRNLLLVLFGLLMGLTAMADSTDWLNFATAKDGDVLQAVQCKNGGRLYLDENEMRFEGSSGTKTIPYAAAGYIYFSEKEETYVESILADSPISLVYDRSASEIRVVGTDEAEISIFSTQGIQLRGASKAKAVSTSGMQRQVVIATAVCGNSIVSAKLLITN